MNNYVTVYSTSTCPYCDMMKRYLSQQGIAYNEVNVQKDPIAARKLVATTGQMSVPQTEVNGQWVIGYNPNRVMDLLQN